MNLMDDAVSHPATIPLPRSIARPATRALESIGVTELNQLTDHSAQELLALHGFGPKALRILRETLGEHGLSLAPDATPDSDV